MFITSLYKGNKVVFGFFSAFIISFILINYKWGAIATPVQQYGMYSELFHRSDTQTVVQVYLNDQLLDYSSYSIAARDMIGTYPEMFVKQGKINEAVYTTMHSLLSRLAAGNLMKKELYTNATGSGEFTNWYKGLMEKITHQKIDKLEWYSQQYVWNGRVLEPLGSPVKMTGIELQR